MVYNTEKSYSGMLRQTAEGRRGMHMMKSEERMKSFIKKQKVAFLAFVDMNGYPNMKAMLRPRKIEGIKTFYFSTNTSSMRVSQYRENPKASVYFYHKGLLKYEGVMLTGKMEILTEASIKRELWRTGDRIFYSKGATDPDYCVLKFTADEGRYYCDLKTESFPVT